MPHETLVMEHIEISMLPENEWQLARVLRFKYTHIDRPCNATVTYFLPFELNGVKHDTDLIDDRIVEFLKSCFNEVSVFKRDVLFTTVKDNFKAVYDGGCPNVKLVVRMTPDIPVDQFPYYIGRRFLLTTII